MTCLLFFKQISILKSYYTGQIFFIYFFLFLISLSILFSGIINIIIIIISDNNTE